MSTFRQAFEMARLTSYDTPSAIILNTPTADQARALLRAWLDERSTYTPGHLLPFIDFVRAFVRYVDRTQGPVQSLWWSQARRVYRVGCDLGLTIGYWQPSTAATFAIGNLKMLGSRQGAPEKLSLEWDACGIGLMLMPRDYSGGVIPDPKRKS